MKKQLVASLLCALSLQTISCSGGSPRRADAVENSKVMEATGLNLTSISGNNLKWMDFKTVFGESCPTGYRYATSDELLLYYRIDICNNILDEWDTVRLADGASMTGSRYAPIFNCQVNRNYYHPAGTLDAALCTATEFAQLRAGNLLGRGQTVVSPDRSQRLVLGADGNLCKNSGCTMILPGYRGGTSEESRPRGLRLTLDGKLQLISDFNCASPNIRILANYPNVTGRSIQLQNNGDLILGGKTVNLNAFALEKNTACVSPFVPVTRPPASLNPYYTKYMSARGVHILGTSDASEWAVRKMHEIVTHMLDALNDQTAVTAFAGAKIVVMSLHDKPTQMPYLEIVGEAFRKEVEDTYRGFSAGYSLTVVTEEMMCKTGVASRVGVPDTTYRRFDQAVHEFAHTMEFVMNRLAQTDAVVPLTNFSAWWKDDPREAYAMMNQVWFAQNYSYDANFNSRLPLSRRDRAGYNYLANIYSNKDLWIPTCEN